MNKGAKNLDILYFLLCLNVKFDQPIFPTIKHVCFFLVVFYFHNANALFNKITRVDTSILRIIIVSMTIRLTNVEILFRFYFLTDITHFKYLSRNWTY